MDLLITQEPREGSCDLPRRLRWAKPVNAIPRRFLAVLALALGLGLGAGACFSPNQPACAFSCADAGLCPTGYTCGADKFCHKEGATGICALDDAATAEAGSRDAAPGN